MDDQAPTLLRLKPPGTPSKPSSKKTTVALKGELCVIQMGDDTPDAYFSKIDSIITLLTDLGSTMDDDDIVTYAINGLIAVSRSNQAYQYYITSTTSVTHVLLTYITTTISSNSNNRVQRCQYDVQDLEICRKFSEGSGPVKFSSNVTARVTFIQSQSRRSLKLLWTTVSVLCNACQLGKLVRLPFSLSETIVKALLLIVSHSDLMESPLTSVLGPVVQTVLFGSTQSIFSRHWLVHQLDGQECLFTWGSLSVTGISCHQPPGFRGADTAYLLLYVDDIVLTASSSDLLQQIITSLHVEFSMTDLGSLNYFLGISVNSMSPLCASFSAASQEDSYGNGALGPYPIGLHLYSYDVIFVGVLRCGIGGCPTTVDQPLVMGFSWPTIFSTGYRMRPFYSPRSSSEAEYWGVANAVARILVGY
ncbi:ribonuclease H-like domain-containing protein [Tanacetum coccineum]